MKLFWTISFFLLIVFTDTVLSKTKSKSRGKSRGKSPGKSPGKNEVKSEDRNHTTSNTIFPNTSVIDIQTLQFTKMTFLHVNQQAQHLHATDEFLTLQFRDVMNYGRNRYLLSRGIADFSEAQVTCSVYGGYLTEMDDTGEFDAVWNFTTRNQKRVQAAYIGVEDREREGTWAYSYSKSLAFTKFHPDEPDGGTSEGCVALHGDKSFQMADMSCYESYHFLCEIPDVN